MKTVQAVHPALRMPRLLRHGFLLVVLGLFLPAAWAAPEGKLAVTLPSADTYAYWVQGASGSVFVLPTRISGQGTFTVEKPLATGDVLYVLDAHNGEIAIESVLADAHGPKPVSLRGSDFKPPAAATAPVLPPSPAPTNPVAAPPPPGGNRLDHLLTGLISLGLAASILWLVWHLVQTRGQPLLAFARRAGVAVPDPTPLAVDTVASVVYTPPSRAPEPVPEEAGLPPKVVAPVSRGPEVSLTGVPTLVGLQGIAVGSTFALTEGDLSIGRDGDNEIVLAENTVSRRHARLVRDRHGQFTISDQGSANGIYINGMKVQRSVLTPGDEVKVGDNYFRFDA